MLGCESVTEGKRAAATALEEEDQQEEDSSPEVYGTDDEGEREENAEDANTRGRGYVASAALMMLREPVRLMRRQLATLGHVPGLITHARAAVCMPFQCQEPVQAEKGQVSLMEASDQRMRHQSALLPTNRPLDERHGLFCSHRHGQDVSGPEDYRTGLH